MSAPVTRAGLADDLRRLGLAAGDLVLVHSSLSRLGFVVGGAVTVVRALLDVLGPEGTLVVPSFTADNSDPSRWALTRGHGVPQEWWPLLRDSLPAFDPAVTPATGVGVVAEAVRTWPGALRSTHPQTSFAAIGASASDVVGRHERTCHLGPESPLGLLAKLGGRVLLLGVGFERCTAFHLAEYLVPDPPQRDYECVVADGGQRRWFRYRDVLLDDRDFGRLGADLEATSTGIVHRGGVGDGVGLLLGLGQAVDFGREWLTAHRRPVSAEST